MNEPTEGAPLAGVKVIDFGQYIAGPGAAMMLADIGADVVRVDPPDGPFWDHPAANVLNRNKRSIALDLKLPEDLEIARRLIATADVVIENFRPGVMEELGLGADAMMSTNPGLVYLSLPGFASTDADARDVQAWEGIIAAASGQFTDMGLNRQLMGVKASFSPLPLASMYGAVLGAMSTALALFARMEHGRGDVIEVPLMAALSEGLSFNSIHVDRLPERYLSLREREIVRRRQAGEPLDLTYDQLQPFIDAFYRTYRCADDRQFYLVTNSQVEHPRRTLALLGLLEDVLAAGIPAHDPYLPTKQWPAGADCTLLAYPLSTRWNADVSARIAAVLEQKPSSHWETLLNVGKAPGGTVRSTEEWLREEHPVAAGLLIDLEDERYGLLRQPGSVAWLGDASVERPTPSPASALDADRGQILEELREAEAQRTRPIETNDDSSTPRGWLDGITVLDITNVIAGPTVSGTLARFGANVIKIEPPRPTFDPWCTVMMGLQSNRDKRSGLIDITTKRGRRALEELIKRADVVTINATTQQLTRLGLDAESIAALNPNAILCQLDTWGGPTGGPWANRLGYDDVVQATTGIMARFGGGLQTPEEHAHFGTIDVLAGYAGAFAIGAALYARRNGVDTHLARASLLASGQLIQVPFMYDYPGRAPFDEPSGPQAQGAGPLYRCYEAADGWFFLACKASDRPALTRELGIDERAEDRQLEQALEQAFHDQKVDAIVAQLRGIDVGAQKLESMDGIRARFLVEGVGGSDSESTLFFERFPNHPPGRTLEVIGRCAVRPARAPITAPNCTPKPGADTRALLNELGYEDEEINDMLERQEIAESWSEEYLPS